MRWIGAALLALGLTACGGGGADTLNHAQLVQTIGKWADKNGAADAKVVCPDDIKIDPGKTFHCLIRKSGQSIRLTVTIENDKGYVTWVTD